MPSFVCSIIIMGVVSIEERLLPTMLPSFIKRSQFSNPMSWTVPVFPKTIIMPHILNGTVGYMYIPATMFPSRFCEAKPMTNAELAPIDAATVAF